MKSAIPTASATVKVLTDEQKLAKRKADFVRLGGKRLANVLDDLKTLEGTANVSSYAWSKEQAEKIGRLIDEQVKSLKAALGEGSDAIKAAGKGKKPGRSVDL